MTKTQRVFGLLFCCLVSFGTLAKPAHHKDCDKTMPHTPGDYAMTQQLADGSTYGYGLHLPKNVDKRHKMPLVVALHYSFQGDKAPQDYGYEFMQWMMSPTFANAIIIAPSSLDKAWHSAQNTDALFDLMDKIKRTYSINDRRVLLTGYSAGSFGVWTIGADHQERFSALLAMSGAPKYWEEPTTPPQSPQELYDLMAAMPTVDTDWHIPVFAIHSNADQNVPLSLTTDYLATLDENGDDQNVTLITLDGYAHFDVQPFLQKAVEVYDTINEIWSKR